MRSLYLLCILGALFATVSATFSLEKIKAAVITKGGSNKQAESASFPKPITETLVLKGDDVLKVGFTVLTSGSGIQPHQCFIIFTDQESSESVPQVVTVRDSGKARFELEIKSAPEDILTGSGNFDLTVQIGSFGDATPLTYKLGQLRLDTPRVAKKQFTTYGPKEEINHIFNPPQKLPPTTISLAFSLITLSPVLLLAGSWVYLGANVSDAPSTALNSVAYTVFLSSIVAFEYILYRYWTATNFNLIQMLPWCVVDAAVAFLSGRATLSDIMDKRLKRGL